MSRLARVGIAACAAAALALPLQAQAATTQPTVAAAASATTAATDPAFTVVARSTTQPVLLGSDAVGSVYVAGDNSIVRYAADGTTKTIALPGTGSSSVAVTPGALYVKQGDHVYRYDGTRWTDLKMPSTIDGWTNAAVRGMVTDRPGEVWVNVVQTRPNATAPNGTEYRSTFLHFDGKRWSALPPYYTSQEGMYSTSGVDVVDGHPVVSTFLSVHYGQAATQAWDGKRWVGLTGVGGVSAPRATAYRSLTDYTVWTAPFNPMGPVPDTTVCSRYVDEVRSDCFSPVTPVVSAAVLADGRTVVATRTSRTDTTAAEGGFYLLSNGDTTATRLTGSTYGAGSVQLEAEPTGGGVWAVTPDGAGGWLVRRVEIPTTATTPTTHGKGKGKGPHKPRRTISVHAVRR